MFRAVRPDIVHVHTPSTSGLTKLSVAAWPSGAPAGSSLYQVAPEALSGRSRLNRAGQYLVDTTIAVSGGTADTQANRAGLSRRRMEIIHNGVEDVTIDVDLVRSGVRRNGPLWLGYFGRLAAEKGVDTLIDALAKACGWRRSLPAGDRRRLRAPGRGARP